jgi:hypothetical protein
MPKSARSPIPTAGQIRATFETLSPAKQRLAGRHLASLTEDGALEPAAPDALRLVEPTPYRGDTIRDRVARAHREVMLLEAAAAHGEGYMFDYSERFVAAVVEVLARVGSDLNYVERDLEGAIGDTPSLDHEEWMRERDRRERNQAGAR